MVPQRERYTFIFTTLPSKREAAALAERLIRERVAACVNLIGGIKSIYWWKGKVESGNETMLIIKTRLRLFSRVKTVIARMSSYELPEIVAVPIENGEDKYLKWIKAVTSKISLD